MARYGYGAEGIIEMKAVLSDGNLVTVTPDKTVFADGRFVISFKGLVFQVILYIHIRFTRIPFTYTILCYNTIDDNQLFSQKLRISQILDRSNVQF